MMIDLTEFIVPCQGSDDPNAWYEIEDAVEENRLADPVRIATALEGCTRCPVREACEKAGKGELGIWGGKTSIERGMRPYTVRGAGRRPPPRKNDESLKLDEINYLLLLKGR
jgi:hypothetical protein